MTGTRVTKEILRNKVDNINRTIQTTDGTKLDLDYAYGGVRLVKVYTDFGGVSDVSERMTKAQMSVVLDTIYMTVLKFGLKSVD